MGINITPLGEQVWVQPLANDTNELYSESKVSNQGALTVIENQKAPSRGIVLAIGPGKRDQVNGLPIPMPIIAEGDIVRWTTGSAQPLQVGKQKLYLIAGSALLGIEKAT